MKRLNKKVVIITGGAGRIGQATAKRFVEEGASLLLSDVDESALQEVVQSLDSESVSYLVTDVTKNGDNEQLVATALERYGRLDAFIANAGIEGAVAGIPDYPEEIFDKVMAINVKGAFLGIKHALPAIAQNGGGSIIILSSIAGLMSVPGLVGYATSKHAVIGLMRTAAKEGAGFCVRVNTINPGPLESRMMDSLEEQAAPGAAEQAKAGFTALIPMGRYGTAEEVADMAVFLASDESSYCTGSTFSLNGGMRA